MLVGEEHLGFTALLKRAVVHRLCLGLQVVDLLRGARATVEPLFEGRISILQVVLVNWGQLELYIGAQLLIHVLFEPHGRDGHLADA